MKRISDIPPHWTTVRLSDLFLDPSRDIVDGPFGSDLKASEYQSEGVPILRIQNISRNRFINQNIKYISASKAQLLMRHNYVPGDIILNKLGDPVGKACIVPENFPAGVIIADLVRIRVDRSLINPQFLTYQFNSYNVVKQFKENTKGTTRPRVKLSVVRNLRFVLPPLSEQNLIVEKIDEFFSEINNSLVGLQKAAKQLIAYRQVILKKAFEGGLTQEWREVNKPVSAELLLNSSIEAKKNEYNRQLESYNRELFILSDKKKAAHLIKPKPPKHLSLFTKEELQGFPNIPAVWKWVKIDGITPYKQFAIKAGPFGSALKKDSYVVNGSYKIYGQEQVIANDPRKGDYYIGSDKYNALVSFAVAPNDILISLVGTIGKVLVLPDQIEPGIINPRVIKITPDIKNYSAQLFKYYFESGFLKGLYSRQTHGATMDVLNLGIIQSLPFPLMSLAEQELIVDMLESQFSIIQELEDTIVKTNNKFTILMESFLIRAFSGTLTKDISHEETGQHLLADIVMKREIYLKNRIKEKRKTPKKIVMNGKKPSVIDILQSANSPMQAKEVWLQSEFYDDIEAFYTELKKIEHQIKEIKSGDQSLLILQHED